MTAARRITRTMIGTFKLTRKPRDPRLWKSCGRTVENLWMSRHEKKDPHVLPTDPTTEAREWPLSRRASLASPAHFSKIRPSNRDRSSLRRAHCGAYVPHRGVAGDSNPLARPDRAAAGDADLADAVLWPNA